VGSLPSTDDSEDSLSLTQSFTLIAAMIIVPYVAYSLYGGLKYLGTR